MFVEPGRQAAQHRPLRSPQRQLTMPFAIGAALRLDNAIELGKLVFAQMQLASLRGRSSGTADRSPIGVADKRHAVGFPFEGWVDARTPIAAIETRSSITRFPQLKIERALIKHLLVAYVQCLC